MKSKNTYFLLILATLAGLSTSIRDAAAATEAALNGIDSSLTVYVYPPRNPINWSSPKAALSSLFRSFLGMEILKDDLVKFESDFGEQGSISSRYRSSLGHTIAHLRCRMPDGDLYDHWASFSGETFSAEDKRILFHDKLGLGALMHDYIDGHIIAGVENIKRITFYRGDTERFKRKRPHYFQVEVDPEQCQRLHDMVGFFESFHFRNNATLAELQERPAEKTLYFTNQIDPYDSYMERLRTGKGKVGGGCAPFGAALLKITGRYKSEFESLWRTPVTISEKLIGGLVDSKTNTIRRVSVADVLFTSLGRRWTYEDEGYANRFVSLYDPQKIWEFTGGMMKCLSQTKDCSPELQKLIREEGSLFQMGETQIFRDSVTEEYERPMGDGGSSVKEKITRKVEQPVRGFVWRLR